MAEKIVKSSITQPRIARVCWSLVGWSRRGIINILSAEAAEWLNWWQTAPKLEIRMFSHFLGRLVARFQSDKKIAANGCRSLDRRSSPMTAVQTPSAGWFVALYFVLLFLLCPFIFAVCFYFYYVLLFLLCAFIFTMSFYFCCVLLFLLCPFIFAVCFYFLMFYLRCLLA